MRNPRDMGREAKDVEGQTVSKTGGTFAEWLATQPKPKRRKAQPARTPGFKKAEALRIAIYYRDRHNALIKALGGKCERCGNRGGLGIRHYKQADWIPDKVSSHCRIARYWREYEAGVDLMLLCRKCNGKDKKVRV